MGWAGQNRRYLQGQHSLRKLPADRGLLARDYETVRREQFLIGLDVDAFCKRAAHYFGELNVLHPFREGNGRSIRKFVGQLARGAGYAVDWRGIGRLEMIQASIEAYEGSSSRLGELIRSNICDLDQERAMDLAKAVAGEKAQISPAVPGCSYEGIVVGETARYVVQAQGDEMVLHARRGLLNHQQLIPGQVVNIRYPHGGVGLVEGKGDSQVDQALQYENQHSRGRDLER